MMTKPEHEQLAREYLDRELGADAPTQLTPLGPFDESPLEGEGAVTLFSFEASIGGAETKTYNVVAGRTVANYYPSYNLAHEDIYSLHVGTRFMLVLEVGLLPVEQLPPSVEADISRAIAGVAPGEPVTDFELVAAFAVEDQKHAVGRCRIGREAVYVLGGDLPLGIYRQIHLPPQVVYRLHLGNVIRMERPQGDEIQPHTIS
jgi:hypothetical protein